MKKNYNYNYVNRSTTKKPDILFSNVEAASCLSSILKDSPINNGRLWHTTDTNEFFYDWNGNRCKLNVTGDNESISADIEEIKAQIEALDLNEITSRLEGLETITDNARAAADAAQAIADSLADVQTISGVVENEDGYVITLSNGSSLIIKNGKDGADGAPGIDGKDGKDGKDGVDGINGQNGTDGKDGKDGVDGKSAYDLAVENGFEGSVEDWLVSLKGANGEVDLDVLNNYATKSWVEGKGYLTTTNQRFPNGWMTDGTMVDLIKDINDDETAVAGKSYFGTVSISDLPAGLSQAEMKVDIMVEQLFQDFDDQGNDVEKIKKVITFTVTSSDVAPYHWEYTSTWGQEGSWRSFLTQHQDISGKANSADLAVVATSGSYNDLGDKPTIPTKVSAFENDADYSTNEELSVRLGMDPDTVLNEYEFIYDENSWNTSFAEGVLKKYYEAYPDEDLVSTTDPSKTAGFNDRIYTGTITGSDDVVSFKATWQEKSQMITNIDNPSEVYYIERLDPTSPYYGTADEWRAQYAKFHGSSWVLYSDATLTTPVDDKEFAIETLAFDGFTHTYQAWVANGARAPWVAIDTTNMAKKIIRFEYEGKDAVYPWSETRFGTGDKIWGIASVPTEWYDNTFLTEDTKDNGKDTWIGEKGVDFGQFDINKFKIMLVSPVKDYVDASIADINIPVLPDNVSSFNNDAGYITNVALNDYLTSSDAASTYATKSELQDASGLNEEQLELISNLKFGEFPDEEGSDPEDEAKIEGLATVQDVIDYVNAFFQKKNEELDYFYVNGIKCGLNETPVNPTSIYQMNKFEIDEEVLTNGIEIYVSKEANGYYAGANSVDTIYSEVFSIDIPVGYDVTVYGEDEEEEDGWATVGEQLVSNPRYSQKEYGTKTYICQVRKTLAGGEDTYTSIGQPSPYSGARSTPTRYKIFISKL